MMVFAAKSNDIGLITRENDYLLEMSDIVEFPSIDMTLQVSSVIITVTSAGVAIQGYGMQTPIYLQQDSLGESADKRLEKDIAIGLCSSDRARTCHEIQYTIQAKHP